MSGTYDSYYQTENLFGNPYPALIEFFTEHISKKGNILDLGCGQGRDAIPLARLGFEVKGIDNSKVGIYQMNEIAKLENLKIKGIVADIFTFDDFSNFDYVLLDSMFHFTKKDRKKETEFIRKIISNVESGCIIVFCIQDTGKKVEILNNTINIDKKIIQVYDKKFEYLFEDKESGHTSKTNYRLIAVKKLMFKIT